MTRAKWSRRAESQLEAYLDYLALQSAPLAERARSEIQEIADQTARRPGLARPSRWRGLFERSVLDWRKLLVCEIQDGAVRVVAFYDTRQDLSAVDPLSK